MTATSELVATIATDDCGPNNWMLDEVRGWPKCDSCGSVMERDQPNCSTHLFAAKCPNDGFALTFKSCRRGHRYCAHAQLSPMRDKE